MKLYQRIKTTRNGRTYRTYVRVTLSDECQIVQGKVICPGYGAAKSASKLYLALLEARDRVDGFIYPLLAVGLLASFALNLYLLGGGR